MYQWRIQGAMGAIAHPLSVSLQYKIYYSYLQVHLSALIFIHIIHTDIAYP